MSQCILIVEDDAMIQGFLRLTLENDGYVVNAAASAAEMRVNLQKGGIDLIILDLGLPDADGLDLVTEIRAVSPVPIIVASARQEASDRVAALERGADDYLTKPFDPTEMLLRVKNLLSRCAASPVPSPTLPQETAQSGPIPPKMKTAPVRPVPQIAPAAAATPPVAPGSAPVAAAAPPVTPATAESSLQAAAKKSAPQPISQAPARGNVDKSVILAGIVAVLAFGGGGFYWFTNSMSITITDRSAAPNQQLDNRDANATGRSQDAPRRGALQPPAELDVKIAQSPGDRTPAGRDAFTRSVTASPQPAQGQRPISPFTTPVPQTQQAEPAPLPADSTAWVKDSNCAPLPDVKWWRVKSHQQIVRYVNREHDGDWQPYLNNWRARVEKLQDISDRGSGIKTSSGEILQGESLADYIRDTAERISVIQCLARDARIATGG